HPPPPLFPYTTLFRSLGTPFHMGADSGRRRIEHVDLVALDDRPPAILVREVWDALVDDAGGAVAQRRIDDVAVSGHPADVRGARSEEHTSELQSRGHL